MKFATSNFLMSSMLGDTCLIDAIVPVCRNDFDDKLQRLNEKSCYEMYSTHKEILTETEYGTQHDVVDYMDR